MEPATEETRLLPPAPPSPRSSVPLSPTHPRWSERKVLRAVTLTILSIFLIEIGDFMQRAPYTRILEDILCRSYYTSLSPGLSTSSWHTRWEPEIPEQDCKNGDIQGKLAMLKGWDLCFSCIPSLLTAVPYGALADRIGRKPVLLLSIFGLALGFVWQLSILYFGRDTVDVRWTWAGSAFFLMGGGSSVALSMFFTIIADVVPENKRAFVFFQITAATVVSTVAGVPIAYWLMRYSVWLPNLLGLGVIVLGSCPIFLIPETLDRHKFHEAAEQHGDEEELSREEEEEVAPVSFSQKNLSGILQRIEDSKFAFKTPLLCVLTFSFLVDRLNKDLIQMLYQLASKRFGWSLGEASFLMPLNSITNFVLLIILLPGIYALLTKRTSLAAATRDLVVARGSLLFFIIGSFGIAFSGAPTLLIISTIVFSLGSGLSGAVRSLLTSLIDPSQVSRLYGVLAVMQTIGTLVAAPTMSKVFSRGMEIGGTWIGMAFIVAGIVYSVVGVGIWGVRVNVEEKDREAEE